MTNRPARTNRSGWLPALAVLGVLALLSCPAAAQPQPSPAKRVAQPAGPSWQSLRPEQRAALAPLQQDWDSIDAQRKVKWLDIAGRYPKLPAAEQQKLQTRMAQWSRLSASERARARLNFQEVKQLPNQERQDRWQAYQALPESQRKALASRATGAGIAKPPPQLASRPASDGVAAARKRNIVANPSLSAKPARAVAPTVVQAAPGATTTLVTRQPAPPAHQQAGLPKIAATPGFVDRNTLLPKRGPQGASVRASGSNAPPARP